jgi:hypothetical protein
MGLFGNTNSLNSGSTGPVYVDFLSNGTWTKPAGLVCIDVIVIGAGGGGGGGAARCGIFCVTLADVSTGGGGGGGGAISSFSLAAGSVNSSYCVIIGSAGSAGAKAPSNGNNGSSGTAGGNSCFGTTIARGGAGGDGGCHIYSNALITASGGAGGTGDTYNGQNGGDSTIQYNTGCGGKNAGAGSGGRGGGGGGGTHQPGNYESLSGCGGSISKFRGIQLGKGGNGCGGILVCNTGQPYGAGGGGGCGRVYSGPASPSDGNSGAQGIVRVIEYF